MANSSCSSRIVITGSIPQISFSKMPQVMFRLFPSNVQIILTKINDLSFPLGKIEVASWGARGVPIQDFHLDKPINEYCKPMIKGKNVKRYALVSSDQWLLYDFKKLYRPAFPELFESKKIVISKVTGNGGLVSSLDTEKYYTDDSLCCCILKYSLAGLKQPFFRKHKIKIARSDIELSRKYDLSYVLGLLNSKLVNFYFRKMLSYDLNVYPESIEQLPIKNINFDDAKEKKIYKDIVDSVNKILKLNAEQNQNKDNLNDNYYEVETEIEKTNTKIDNLVYELYGLTEEEIKIIEAQ